ncbi:substrate-binding periplasmic protein [Bdellovibrio sp. HCB185ZH]|uniref:substrate-binding periplasmic protein n=1 Tax=Bdellovibrio sp. HCB185ZH TaxID=3394235 RepID=UPI0039A65CD0
MLSLLISFALSFPVLAQVKNRGISSCEKRYVLAFLDAAPGFYKNEKGNKEGSSYDILMEVGRRLGCKINEEPGSYSAILEGFVRHRVDITGLTTKSPKMENVGEFVEMYRVPRSLVVRKDSFGSHDSIETILKNPKITFAGIIGGLFFIKESEKEQLFKERRLREVPGPQEIFNALAEGRAQATFSSPAFTAYYLKRQNKMDQFKIIPDEKGEWQSLGFYLSTKRLSQDERERIRSIISNVRQDGTLLKIEKKYVNPVDYLYYEPVALKDVSHIE